jgi:hypothetical protein
MKRKKRSATATVIKQYTDLEGEPVYVRVEAINLIRAPLPGEYGFDSEGASPKAGAVLMIGAQKLAVRETALSIAEPG